MVSLLEDRVYAEEPSSWVVTSMSKGAYSSETWRQTSWIQASSAVLNAEVLPSLS